jgi:hypothetical protein
VRVFEGISTTIVPFPSLALKEGMQKLTRVCIEELPHGRWRIAGQLARSQCFARFIAIFTPLALSPLAF